MIIWNLQHSRDGKISRLESHNKYLVSRNDGATSAKIMASGQKSREELWAHRDRFYHVSKDLAMSNSLWEMTVPLHKITMALEQKSHEDINFCRERSRHVSKRISTWSKSHEYVAIQNFVAKIMPHQHPTRHVTKISRTPQTFVVRGHATLVPK